MVLVYFQLQTRVKIAKFLMFILAVLFLYATIFQGANYNLIFGWKILELIPFGLIMGIIAAILFYWYKEGAV